MSPLKWGSFKAKPSLKSENILKTFQVLLAVCQLFNSIAISSSAQLFRRQKPLLLSTPAPHQDNVVAEMQVVCQSDAIVLLVNTNNPFNGMLYAKDAPGSANCVSEIHSSTNMTFRLPLKSCGTLSAEVDDGIEYFNTIVVQPHMRLMTNQGKGYHIRCKYQTRERTISNTHFNVSAAFTMQNGPQAAATPLLATASMPMCTMKIYRIDQDNVAESVKVGDKLVMVIEIDKQDMYGMRVTNCVVRDGMNKAEQLLINDHGCPVDETIMPKFEYEQNNTRGAVVFKAHKFPHTSSVYYQCNVRLCINNGGCDPVDCKTSVADSMTSNASSAAFTVVSPPPSSYVTQSGGPRRKRFVPPGHQFQEATTNRSSSSSSNAASKLPPIASELKAMPKGTNQDLNDMTFDVYSGLYVSDISDIAESNANDPNGQQVLPARRNENQHDSQDPCLTVGKASLLVIVASFGSVALVLLIACQTGQLGPSETSLEQRSRQTLMTRPVPSKTDTKFSPTPGNRYHHHHQPMKTCGRPSVKSSNSVAGFRYGLSLMC